MEEIKKAPELLGLDDLKYDQNGLIPAVIQDAGSGAVLMVAYMNRESLQRTIESGKTCFWSRSRQAYWVKGETSGNFQEVRAVYGDCDADTLLIKVIPGGPGLACHTGRYSCFFRPLKEWPPPEAGMPELARRRLSDD